MLDVILLWIWVIGAFIFFNLILWCEHKEYNKSDFELAAWAILWPLIVISACLWKLFDYIDSKKKRRLK